MTKVSIILVTYNRSDVTNLTLDSLVKASSSVAFEVILVDNASRPEEIEKIDAVFSYLKENGSLKGTLIRNPKNDGFAGGNNIGLRLALGDPSVTHICLLNNDVIVTDGWLEALLEHTKGNLVGPVSNNVGNEQIVFTDYPVQGPSGYTREAARRFARSWREKHSGNVVGTKMLGFFCVLGERVLFERVGFLDERFGLGYYEDDDFCLRILEAGFEMKIVREAFVHHWGSASFSRLGYEAISQLFRENRAKFEAKHGIAWKQPKTSRELSLIHEIEWLSSRGASPEELAELLNAWVFRWLSPRENLWHRISRKLIQRTENSGPRAKTAAKTAVFVAETLLFDRQRSSRRVRAVLAAAKQRVASCFSAASASGWLKRRSENGKSVVILPIQGFYGRKQRPQHLAKGLAKEGYFVYWVEPSSPRKRKGSVVLRAKGCDGRLSILRVAGIDFSDFYTTGITESRAATLLDTLSRLLEKELGQGRSQPDALVIQSPFWARAAARSKAFKVFDCMDLHRGFASATAEVEMLEALLLKSVDHIVVTSDFLFKEVSASVAELGTPVSIVKNGADPLHFKRRENGAGKKVDGDRAIAGYFGAVAEWFDAGLLIKVARLLPEIDFEIIGDHTFSGITQSELPGNVRLLGEMPYATLPRQASRWSVGLIPFKLTELILATHPVKLVEYSALELPIIATRIPEVESAPVRTYTASGAEEFAASIRRAIAEDSDILKKERREYALTSSWSARSQALASLLSRA